MKPGKSTVLGLLLLLIGGCWSQTNIEKIGLSLQLGLEIADNGQLLYTLNYPVFGMGNQTREKTISVRCDILRDGRETCRRMASLLPQAGQLQQVFFSKELAQQGLFPWLEIFQREPSLNSPYIDVVIVDGSPKELMKKAALLKDNALTAFYVKNLLANNNKSYTLQTNTLRFNINYLSPGLDAVTPLIKLEPQMVRLTGMALFAGDRLVGTVESNQATLLLAMMGQMKETEYIFRRPVLAPGAISRSKPATAARIAIAKRKIKIQIKTGYPDITIDLGFSALLDEYLWDRMDLPKSQHQVEEGFAKELNKECQQLVTYMQQSGSDPLGIGDRIRADYPQYWLENNPEQIYKKTRITVKNKVRILKYGAIR